MKKTLLALGLSLPLLLAGCDLKGLPTGAQLQLEPKTSENELTRSGLDELIRLHEEGLVDISWKNTDHYVGTVTEFLVTAQTLQKTPLRSAQKLSGRWAFPSETPYAGEIRISVHGEGQISGEVYHLGPVHPTQPRELFKVATFDHATFENGLLVVRDLKEVSGTITEPGSIEARVGFDQQSNLVMVGFFSMGEKKPFACKFQ